MTETIENTLRPASATEVALLDRIGQLKRQLWEAGRFHNTVDGFPLDPNSVPVEVRRFDPVLHLAGSSEAALDLPRGLRIEARTHGKTALGVANYVPLQDLQQLRFFDEARLLGHLHERVIRQAGKLVQDHLRQPE